MYVSRECRLPPTNRDYTSQSVVKGIVNKSLVAESHNTYFTKLLGRQLHDPAHNVTLWPAHIKNAFS